ncbi:hypothetical protein ACIOEX_28655, partial [Streptomyces sp. NPDC087850]|uniref:hypothetical protein n=1 Tax=Streptomyces sp. NPDC087850 TaxID=3365809 RepID=UPI0037F5A1BC
MSALTDSIERALGDAAEDYDIDAIADALRPLGAESVDDFPSEEFWSTVAAHALPAAPQEPAPLDRFKAELTAAFWTEAGDPALWRRGGVTLEVVGASRVNFDMPQMFTTYRITVAGTDEVTVLRPHEVASWPALWAAVSARLDGWTSSVAARRAEYAQAVAAERAARAAAHRAVEA